MKQNLLESLSNQDVQNYILQTVPFTTKHFIQVRLSNEQRVYAKCKTHGCSFGIHYNKSIKKNSPWTLSRNDDHNHDKLQLVAKYNKWITLQMVEKHVIVSPATGYCGFHAIANRVYQDSFQHFRVKMEMLYTFNNNLSMYQSMK